MTSAIDSVHSPWIHEDDQLLRKCMQTGGSLISLAKGAVKFSRKYTFREIQDRWCSILYDPDISNQASANMALLDLSGSNRSSKRERVPEKRKYLSIRRHYYAMRKRLKKEFFSSQNVGIFEERKFQDHGTTDGGDAMLDDCLANNLGFEEKDFEILRQAFPESLGSIPTTATTTTTTIVAVNPTNAFHLERCHNSAENDIINGSVDVSPSPNEYKTGPSGTPPNEKLTKNDKLIFGGKHHFNSPVSDGSASFHTIGGFPSPSTRLPLWKAMEDISAPDMPVDETHADSHQVAEEALAHHDDKSLPEFDGAHLVSPLGDRPHSLINCIEYTDSLLNLPNEDDILIMDADAKDTTHEAIQEVDLCSADAVAGAVTASISSPNLEIDYSFHSDQHNDCDQEVPEGKNICTLNTEDPDIPCNDDIFLLIHPSTQLALSVGPHIATDSIGPLSSSSHERDGDQGLVTETKGKDPPSFTRSLTGGPNALPEFVSPHLLVHPASKCGPPDGEYPAPLPIQTMPIHTPLNIIGNGMPEEDASKVELRGLSSSAMYRETPLPLEVGSVKMTDLESMADPYISENNSDSDGDIPYFSDVEAMILEMDLVQGRESYMTDEVEKYQNEEAKRMMMRLEQTARSSFQRVMSSQGAFAVFYSRRLTHYIKKVEVTIGRSTNENEVDIDLRKEGRANKISRRQAIIKMETDGSFSLKNLGANSISLNGEEVAHGELVALASSSLIEIRGMFFMFEINDKYVRRFLSNKPS